MHSTVERPTSSVGRTISTLGSRAVFFSSASIEMRSPGRMIPPRYSRPAVNDVERRRGAEVDDDQVAARIEMHGADRVGDPVGTHFERVAVADLQAGLGSRLQDERIERRSTSGSSSAASR